MIKCFSFLNSVTLSFTKTSKCYYPINSLIKTFCLQDFVLDLATLYLFLGKDMSDWVFVLINYSIDLISDRRFTAGIVLSSAIPVKDHFLRNWSSTWAILLSLKSINSFKNMFLTILPRSLIQTFFFRCIFIITLS